MLTVTPTRLSGRRILSCLSSGYKLRVAMRPKAKKTAKIEKIFSGMFIYHLVGNRVQAYQIYYLKIGACGIFLSLHERCGNHHTPGIPC